MLLGQFDDHIWMQIKNYKKQQKKDFRIEDLHYIKQILIYSNNILEFVQIQSSHAVKCSQSEEKSNSFHREGE